MLSYKKQSRIKIAVMLIIAIALTLGFTVNKISADFEQEDAFGLVAEFLQRLAFISEDDISEDKISRAEMAFYIAGLYDAEIFDYYEYEIVTETLVLFDGTEYESENRVYDDPWVKNYAAAIAKCIEEGVMPDKSWFDEPEGEVTLHDALVMLIAALRYEHEDVQDYAAKASSKEVRLIGEHATFTFAGVRADKSLSKNEAIMLVYNFLLSEFASETVGRVEPVWDAEIERYENRTIYFKQVISMYNLALARSTPASSSVLINGREIIFDSYNIEGSNYFKLRDLAYALNGTEKQFDIEEVWQVTAGDTVYELQSAAMHLLTGQPYTPVGGEMAERGTLVITAFSGRQQAQRMPDNFWISFRTFIINGEHYFAIRDVAQALDFSVVWDEAANAVLIDTSKPYTPE